MGLLGELLSLPINVINIPLEVADRFMAGDENVKVLSAPLEIISEIVSGVDE